MVEGRGGRDAGWRVEVGVKDAVWRVGVRDAGWRVRDTGWRVLGKRCRVEGGG